MDGRAGRDLVVKVPCGTLVWRLDAAADGEISRTSARREYQSQSRRRRMLRTLPGEADADGEEAALPVSVPAAGGLASGPESRGELVIDLVEPGQRFVLCQGGRGGLGNRNFATAVRQTPRFAQPGEPGGEGNFLLELRIMAEVGLVGYPNAGKSTLLTAISRARPKIAPYPFTTLHPQIGIVEYPDYHRLTVCDVPGLIEGAHRNVGLGHEFLRHIERCKVLVLLLDMAGTDGRAPWDDYRSLLRELELYDPALVEKPRLIVANKMDEAAARENLKAFKCRIRRVSILSMAAAFGEGLAEFKQAIRAAAG